MRKIFVFLLAFSSITRIMAQPAKPCSACLPDGITFSTQSEIDNFQVNYPGCTSIMGGVVTISGSDITNLNGLSVLTSIVGILEIKECNNLTSLSGLDNLTSIGSILYIHLNSSLTGLSALNHLTSIGSALWIESNVSLSSITGLSNLTSINGTLNVDYNPALTSLSGLDNIDTASISGYFVVYNSSLSDCAVKSLCDFLASGTIFNQIHNNASGCNSPFEVGDACEHLDVETLSPEPPLTIYPNPAASTLVIGSGSPGLLTIQNPAGQLLLQCETTGTKTILDISGWKSGIYFVQIAGVKGLYSGKILKL